MPILRLIEPDRDRLVAIPETGMGFQIVRGTLRAGRHSSYFERSGVFLILNCQYAIPFIRWDNRMSLDTLHELGERGELPQEEPAFFDGGPELIDDPIAVFDELGHAFPSPFPPFFIPGMNSRSGVVHSKTGPRQAFFRYSAFYPDLRVMPNGGFVAGTYATTYNDAQMVPSGLSAVGRYALPNPLPASQVYILVPMPQTQLVARSVVPNFNQAGGGVEIFFPAGAQPDPAAPHELPPA